MVSGGIVRLCFGLSPPAAGIPATIRYYLAPWLGVKAKCKAACSILFDSHVPWFYALPMDAFMPLAIVLLVPLLVAIRCRPTGFSRYAYIVAAFLMAWALVL